MRNTTLPLLMGLISSLYTLHAHAQDSGSAPSAAPNAPTTTAPPTNAVPQSSAPPVGGSGRSGEETTPFIFGIRQGLTGDSNVFRAPEGSEFVRRDRIWSTGLHLGLDKSIGRQHFLLDLQADANRYNKNKHLNNTEYAGNARWDWETVGRLSGQFTAQQRQGLFRDIMAGSVSFERNQVRSTSLGAQARLGLVTRWSFEAGVAGSESDYMGSEVNGRDVRQTAINAGLRYRPSTAVTTGLGVRRTEGRYPNLATGVDEFTRDDIDLTTTFNASGASTFNSRLSSTREKHTSQALRDANGWTGALGWRWRPTGKLTTQLDLSHDRSVGQAALDSALIGVEASDASEADSAALSVTWDATAKISIVPRVSYARRKLDNTFTTGGTPTATGTDTTVLGGLALNYTPFDALSLTCQVTQERRRTAGAGAVTVNYVATVAGCNAEFAIR
ncbi:MAG: hypothetical protein ABW190_11555 [Rhizobacter sp.]